MRPKAEWAIDSEPMRVRGIIVLVIVLVKKISRQNIFRQLKPLFWFSKPALFATSGLSNNLLVAQPIRMQYW